MQMFLWDGPHSLIKCPLRQQVLLVLAVLVGCQSKALATRDVEVVDSKHPLPYASRISYQRALSRVLAVSQTVGVGPQDVLHIQIQGQARSSSSKQYFDFSRRSFRLKSQHCRVLLLTDQPPLHAVPLHICYVDGELHVDPDVKTRASFGLSSIFLPTAQWEMAAPIGPFDTEGAAQLHRAVLRIRRESL